MSDRPSSFDVGGWPARVWATALAAGAVVFLLVLMLGAHWLFALLLGAAAFLAAAWLLRRGAAPLLTTPSVVEEGHGAPARDTPAEAAPEPAPAAAAFVAAPAAAGVAPPGPSRPASLEGPRGGQADDLKRIKGVGPKLEGLLNSLGYYHFDQIAGWREVEIAWVDSNLDGFNGRATRDDWVGQARLLAAGGETEFSQHVDRGEVY